LARLKAQFVDEDGVTWKIDLSFSSRNGWLKASYSLAVDGIRQLLKFQGPRLCAGDLSYGSAKSLALLPGLEYLLSGENSSSPEFTGEAYRYRVVPHPYKVTTPFASVTHGNGTLIFAWDPLQRWDGFNMYPSVKFVSPNWLEEQDDHVVELFIPSIPGWVEEGGEIASTPYMLNDTIRLNLTAYITYVAASDVDGIYRVYLSFAGGIPEPQQPSVSIDKAMQIMVKGLLGYGWRGSGWQAWTPGPVVADPRPAVEAMVAAASLELENLSRRIWYIIDEVHRLRNLGKATSVDTDSLVFGFYTRGAERLVGEPYRNFIKWLLSSQEDDGSWRFKPRRKEQENLGRKGDTAVGICMEKLVHIAFYYRLTGDEEVYSRLVKGLNYTRRFTRPEGAQTWEVPLHAPDIYASALAVQAYVDMYEATGDRGYLAEAVKWAYRGLPFIYLWRAHDREIMLYATIPVFASSFYRHPWFGRAVQWNGLAYAYSLQRLAKHDDSLPWDVIARGILYSAIDQMLKSPVYGYYPDSYDIVEDHPNPAWINPELILRNVLMLKDYDLYLHTRLIKTDGMAFRVTCNAVVEEAKIDGGRVNLRLRYIPGLPVHLFIQGLKAEAMYLNGEPLAKTDGLEDAGWTVLTWGTMARFTPASSHIDVKIKFSLSG